MHRIIELLYDEGYRGVVGVDSIIDENEQLIPIIELNARFTQVTYLLPLICRFFQLTNISKAALNDSHAALTCHLKMS